MKLPYQWTVKIGVHPTWVADGLDLTAERVHELICNALPHVSGHEVEVQVLDAPAPGQIAVERGEDVIGLPKYKPLLCERCEAWPCSCRGRARKGRLAGPDARGKAQRP